MKYVQTKSMLKKKKEKKRHDKMNGPYGLLVNYLYVKNLQLASFCLSSVHYPLDPLTGRRRSDPLSHRSWYVTGFGGNRLACEKSDGAVPFVSQVQSRRHIRCEPPLFPTEL